MITFESLTKTFATSPVVDDLSLDVPSGSFLVLLGPSGCGKSTTLRMIAGLERPTSGRIALGGRDVYAGRELVPAGHRDLGLVFQSYALWPHMTVRRNVEWPLRVAKLATAERRQRVADVLDLLDIGELADRYPSELSGGQQQRVAIARTLGPRPSLLLLDEPLSNLDAKLRAEMRVELQRLHRRLGTTTVYVTHDQTEAMSLATHIAVLNRGRLEQFGTPADLLHRPASPFVARFVGSPPANVLVADVDVDGRLSIDGRQLATRLDASDDDVRTVEVAYDPARCTLDPDDPTGIPVTVLESAPVAGRLVVTIETPDAVRLSCVLPIDAPVPESGTTTRLVLPATAIATFPRSTPTPAAVA